MKLSVCKPIDELLNGGIESGCITNFYGTPAAGKSNIAFCAAVSCVKGGKKVIYMDTEGGFSVERMEQIFGGREFSEKIILLEPKTWEEQKEDFKKVEDILGKEDIGLIIIDSITALWRLTITDENAAEVNKEIATQFSLLSKFSRERKIPVLTTNQVYADIETGRTVMSNKNIVKWWSKNIVELSIDIETRNRIARIEKARALPENKMVEFRIEGNGLVKADNIGARKEQEFDKE